EAARLAPSASNRQEWRFILVRDEEMRRRLAEAARGQKFVGEAPAVIVACSNTSDHIMPCGLHCHPIDVAIAMTHITLVATEEGLGTCWIGAFDADKVRDLLGIPEEIVVVGMLPIGYPDAEAPPKKRLAMDEILFQERWGA
ncbi:MAG: nitroreductase family protein, partial [Armatimonadetes bacterium]|nr:nitroreductase family protein [Armatimonadota bacterium]